MGRPAKPTALKAIEGNRGKRGANQNEPEFDLLSDLEPPAHLAERSAAVWRELAWMLRKAQVLTVADKVAFELLCDSIADYRFVRSERGDSFVTKSPKTGAEMLDQLLVAQQMLAKRAEGFMSKFGMDPASRSKVMVDPQGDLFGKPAGQAAGTSRFFNK
jgi:P27 family predicted phage terminase small subunit